MQEVIHAIPNQNTSHKKCTYVVFFSNMAGRQQVYFIFYMLAVFLQKNVSILCTFLYVDEKKIIPSHHFDAHAEVIVLSK